MSALATESILKRRPEEDAEKQIVPTILRRGLYVLLFAGTVASFLRIDTPNPLPTTLMLDAWIILFLIASILRGRLYAVVPALLLSMYLLSRFLMAAYKEAPFEDTLQAYKWVIYLVVYAFTIGRSWGSIDSLIKMTWLLIIFTLVKYSAVWVLEGSGSRPNLLVENNFELALLSGLLAVLFPHMNNRRWVALVLLGIVVLLSESRSGAVVFLVLALYTLLQVRHQYRLGPLLIAFCAPVAAAFPAWIFMNRAAESTNIDRLNFFTLFLDEVRDWNALDWLLGTWPITPLSTGTCRAMAYWESLFSSTGDGTCYSVILHAFIMRVVFDAGFFGLVLAYGGTWYLLRRGGVQPGLALSLVAIAFANGLSVSGLNNPYVGLSLLVATLVAGKTEDEIADISNDTFSTGVRQSPGGGVKFSV